MKTAGEVLKQARLKHGLLLDSLSAKTKIPLKFLKAIEADNYQALPALTFSLGFIKNYAQVLGLESAMVSALFKRGYTNYQDKNITPPMLKVKKASFWNPKTGVILIIGIILTGFFVYLGWQLMVLNRSPQLDLELPQENQLVDYDQQTITIKGRTDSDVTLTVNGDLISVDSQGQFESEYRLTSGEDNLLLVVRSRRGKTTTLVRHLKLIQK